MSDINGQIVQSAAPGALLRSAAEAQNQDPTKSQQPDVQPSSPIRSLTQNPIESTLPTTTPRILNSGPVQQPSPDFTGLHAMLSSAPVPPPHVAAQLIRAMMTPPAGANGGVVNPTQPAAPTSPSISSGAPAQPGSVSAPSQPIAARPAQASVAPASSGGQSSNGGFSPVTASLSKPSFTSAPSGQLSQPQTRQNVLGNTPFIGGTVGNNVAKGAEDLGGELLGKASRFLAPISDILGGISLSDFITNRLGLGGFFNPKQVS